MKSKQIILIASVLIIGSSLFTLLVKTPGLFIRQNRMSISDNYLNSGHPEEISVQNSKMVGAPIVIAPSRIPPYNNDNSLYVEDRVYQKSSSHSVVVKDVSSYLRSMKEYILSIDGKVLNYNFYSGEKYNNGSIYAKVPVEKFEEVASRVVENVKMVFDESVSSQDVTGQLVNTTERLQNLKDSKSLKEAALKDAKTEVEKKRYQIEIDRLQAQIVSAEKNVEGVEQKVEYATISISATDSEKYYNPSTHSSISEEFSRAWDSVLGILRIGGFFAIWILVYSIIWLPVIWILKKLILKLKK